MTDKKGDLYVMDTSSETCLTIGNKKRKMSNDNIKASNKMLKNVTKVVEKENETTGAVKTRKYCRRKLTAENLKTILRYVLANKSVLAMVQNTMKLQKDKTQTEIEGQPVSKESEAKEFVMPPWPLLTPRKLNEISKNLLEEVYSEESASDEDYEPNEEELSDDDTILSVKDDLNSSKVDEFILPDLKSPDHVSDDEDALVIALPEPVIFHDKEVDKIAERTRSKICLNSTPIEAIESSFQPPDITMDMYNNHCDNAAWEEFICDFTLPLNKASGVGSVADDTEDEKDPEYKVQEEEEEEEEDEDEEFDYDEILGENPLEVPGDEVKDLMTEILEFAQEDKSLLEEDFSFLEELSLSFEGVERDYYNSERKDDQTVSQQEENENNSNVESGSNELETNKTSEGSIEKENPIIAKHLEVTKSHSETTLHLTENSPSKTDHIENVREEWIIPEERIQLDEQMRMYVQLLTQSYVLSHAYSNLHFINASSKEFLNDLKLHASAGIPNSNRSAFYAHNLDDALDIIKKFESLPEPDKGKLKKLNKGIRYNVKNELYSSKAFIYPELLPKNGFYTFFCASKATFTPAEDNLIALGLEQFSHNDDPVIYIRESLLPTKSTYQIRGRIKNSKQKKESENAIAYFYKHKKLPKIDRVIRVFDPNNMKAPKEYPPTALPPWMVSFKDAIIRDKNTRMKNCTVNQERKQRLILPRIQLVPTIIQTVCPQGASQLMIGKVFSTNSNKSSNEGPSLMLPKRNNRRKKRLAKNQVNKSSQCPESPSILSGSCVSLAIKQEPQSDGPSDDESENSSDSSSECSVNFWSSLQEKNYLLEKHSMVTRSMNMNHKTCQTELSFSDVTQTLSPVMAEERLLSENSSNGCLENNSTDSSTHSKVTELKSVVNSSYSQQTRGQIEHSIFTERSLRIVTSQGDESSDSEQSIPECNELLEPLQKFHCSIIEDAVLPPTSSSGQKRQPSDFSAIRDIICSEEKRKKLLDFDKPKVQPKKKCKPKKIWSIKEDQLILSNCQRYGINKRAFRASADELGELTPLKVKQRFIYLLKLLSEKLKNEK